MVCDVSMTLNICVCMDGMKVSVCMYVCDYGFERMRVYGMCLYVYGTHTYMYMHTHTYIYIYTHTHRLRLRAQYRGE